MPIDLNCSGCGQRLRVPDDSAGHQARCPACGEISEVPWSTRARDSSPGPSDNPFADLPAPSALASDNPYQSPASATVAPLQRRADWTHAMLASRSTRFFGALLDGILTLVGGIPGGVLFFATIDRDDETTLVGLVAMVAGMLVVGIINWVMIVQRGQSIGKRVLGMRIIVRDTGALPGFVRGVLLRVWVPAAINQACNLFSLVDALWIFSDERRCLHDLIAGTIVVDVSTEGEFDVQRSRYAPPGSASRRLPDTITVP